MDKCACKGAFLERFIQPSILMYLNREKLYGFSLLKRLRENDSIDYSGIDPAGLYRMLKKMERAGLLTSEWDIADPLPPRRIYAITEAGRNCLIRWGETLSRYAESVGKLSRAVLSC